MEDRPLLEFASGSSEAGRARSSRRLPEERDVEADVRLGNIEGIPAATVAILEEAGYKTLNDIIDLERDDYLKLAGITPGESGPDHRDRGRIDDRRWRS